MRRLIPLLVVLAACSSTPEDNGPPVVNRDQMGEPHERNTRVRANGGESSTAPERTTNNSVLAYVNGEVITYRDVLLRVGPQLKVLDENQQKAELERSALVEIVRDRVIFHAAREAGVDLTRDDVDSARSDRVREIERNGGTFDAFLAERQMTRREFDEQMKRDMVMERYMRSAMGLGGGDPRVRPMTDTFVSPAEVREYWDRNQKMFFEPAHAVIRMMTIRDADDPAAARKTAEDARARLLSGEDWVPVYRETVGAEKADEDPYGLVDMRRDERAKWMEDFAFDSARGTVSDVIEGGSSFFVMQAEGSYADRVAPFDEVRDNIRQRLGQLRRAMASYEVELRLLEQSSVRPAARASEIRELLRSSRRDLIDQYGL